MVRKVALQNLLRFCSICKTSYMESILDILEKVKNSLLFHKNLEILSQLLDLYKVFYQFQFLKVPFEGETVRNENDCGDVKLVLKGLLDIFIVAIHQQPSSNAIRILSILVSFLEDHYRKPYIFESVIDIRWIVSGLFSYFFFHSQLASNFSILL